MDSSKIRKIFHPLKRIPGVEFLLGKAYRKYIYMPARKKEIEIFQHNALSVLELFDQTLSSLNVPYSLMWGSLIGAVRERGFIKHDFDIDVALWINDYSDCMKSNLINKGFTHKHRFLVDNGKSGMEDTFEKDGVAIDLFYFYEDKNTHLPYCCSFDYINGEVTWENCIRKYGTVNLYKFHFNFPKKFIRTKFESIDLPIPENYDEILRAYYGDNYMIPDPNWGGGEPFSNKWNNRKIDYIRY